MPPCPPAAALHPVDATSMLRGRTTAQPDAAVVIDAPTAADARVGCAGWSLPAAHAGAFPRATAARPLSVLQRYAARFDVAEINSSFYRPHQAATYQRWADSVPARFRFAVKLPKAITHEAALAGAGAALDVFLGQAGALGTRLGWLLVQLPPSLAFERRRADAFFRAFRQRHAGSIALEARHPTWFAGDAQATLDRHGIERVLADPLPRGLVERVGTGTDACAATLPALANARYLRLHGSPHVYYDAYTDAALTPFARHVAGLRAPWIIFDNTAAGHAVGDALRFRERLHA